MAAINLLQRQTKKIVEYLAKKGDEIIRKAALTRGTKRRKGNQLDAYGWCVYYGGKRAAQGYLTPSKTADTPHRGWSNKGYGRTFGRDDVVLFFDEYEPQSDGFILVCVNAVFYTTIQENPNTGRGQVKYRVISQIASDMQNIADNFKGARIYTTL